MIDRRRPRDQGAIRLLACGALLLSGALLQACAPSPPPGPRLRVYAADLAGAAKTCDAGQIKPADGQATETTIQMANDGGWCGVRAQQGSGRPFDAGLLTVRPAHGNVLIHAVGDDTRIDYTPDGGFAGSDSFAVKVIPGDATIKVAVAVTTAAKPPAEAPAAVK